ncbi:TIP-1 family-domain-containing protein, partial [Umbelopsis sp. PMI_123]
LYQTTDRTRTTIAATLQRTQQAVDKLKDLQAKQIRDETSLQEFCAQHSTEQKDTYKQAELVSKLVDLETKLTKLDNTRQYVKVLIIVDELSSRAKSLVKEDPQAALKPYGQLAKLTKVTKASSLSGCNTELIEYMTIRQTTLWEELKDILSKKFNDTLKALQWPVPLKPPYNIQTKEHVKLFEQAFSDLLLLQLPLTGLDESGGTVEEDSYQALVPIQLMLDALSLRFRFHFEGSRPTNRLDKPEWYMNHTIQTISQHLPFIIGVVQPVIDKYNSPSLRNSAKTDFITGILNDLKRKLQKSIPQILQQPALLSHTIHESLSFDQTLRERFAYNAPKGSEFNLGLAQVIVGNTKWFDAWLQMEKEFAVDRFNEIVHDRNAWDFTSDGDDKEGPEYTHDDEDDDYEDDKDTVLATKSASRILSLVEGITESYRLLPLFEQRLRFLMEIQIDLLESYHRRIASAVDSFEALSLIRSVPVPGALPDAVTGVMTSTEKSGTTGGLQRLCRWWASAITVRDRILEWGEDDFFLEMWSDLNHKAAKAQALTELNTSLNALPDPDSYEDGTVFTEVADELYDTLCAKIQKTVVKMVSKDWSVGARSYSKSRNWTLAMSDASSSEISAELYRPVADLKRNLNYLASALPTTLFHSVLRNILIEIDDWFWKNIVTAHQFSRQGGYQLQLDVSIGVWQTARAWVKKPENSTRRLKEALILLTLPSITTANTGQTSASDPRLTCTFLINAISNGDQDDDVRDIVYALAIERLDVAQIREVLRRRSDVAAGWF